jgi:hypothetical protein
MLLEVTRLPRPFSISDMMARAKKSVAPEPKMERHAPEAYWHPQDATERDLGLKRLLSCEYDGFIASHVDWTTAVHAPGAGAGSDA